MPRSSKSKASATGVAKSAAGQARAIAASSKPKRRAANSASTRRKVATRLGVTSPRRPGY